MNRIKIPVFPLNGTIFFPQSSLPLNIFEQRYLDMVDFALSHNRLIGMIQKDDNKKFYKIGCLGKIVSFEETSDGRYLIDIIGKNYYSILKQSITDKNRKFIIAEIKIEDNEKNNKISLKNFNRILLLEKYKSCTNKLNYKIDFEILQQIDSDDLIKFIAMSFPFSTADKQMLLETYNLNELGNKLTSLFDFYSPNEKNKNLIN